MRSDYDYVTFIIFMLDIGHLWTVTLLKYESLITVKQGRAGYIYK